MRTMKVWVACGTVILRKRKSQRPISFSGIDSKDNDGKYKGLGDKIKELVRIAMLPKPIEDLAHKIVKTGNNAAHSTVDTNVVPLIQNFFRVLINHVYVLPM